MFLLELYLKSRQAKLRAWRRRGEEWVREKNNASNYSHYDFDDYAKKFPCPVIQWGKVLAVVLPILGIGTVAALGILAIVTAPPKKVDPNNPNDCTTVVKKDDKVGVTGTDFKGSKGTVLVQREDCSVIMNLEESTYTMEICERIDKNYCTNAQAKGTILRVEKSSDVVKL